MRFWRLHLLDAGLTSACTGGTLVYGAPPCMPDPNGRTVLDASSIANQVCGDAYQCMLLA